MSAIKLALVLGSTREGRFADRIGAWAGAEIARHGGFDLDVIDPAVLDLPGRHEREDGPGVLRLRRRIARADAFVVVTPEYNHGYPAALKFLIDSVYEEWGAKPVAFVAYGGASGGVRAIEQLRPVFAELHAVTIRDSVSFASYWEQFDANGELRRPQPARRAMATMLDRLSWWATALRHARAATPYRTAAA